MDSSDFEEIQLLILRSATPIHHLDPNRYSHTPLQHALSLSSPYPLRTVLSSFFVSSHPVHKEEQSAVIDELIARIYPHSQPALIEETKAGFLGDSSHSSIMDRVCTAIHAISMGEFVVVCDGEDRENEGDLIIAAECVTTQKIAFMINETSGIICVGMNEDRTQQLNLPQMVEKNTEGNQTAFTVSVDYNINTTTGISASDRAATIIALSSPLTQPHHLSRPGHIFPLRARHGGVLTRPGHTEASVDLAQLAGKRPIAAMCEIVSRDGSMIRPTALRQWSHRHRLPCITIADLIYYRRHREREQQTTAVNRFAT